MRKSHVYPFACLTAVLFLVGRTEGKKTGGAEADMVLIEAGTPAGKGEHPVIYVSWYAAVAYRDSHPPEGAGDHVGFRCVRPASPR